LQHFLKGYGHHFFLSASTFFRCFRYLSSATRISVE